MKPTRVLFKKEDFEEAGPMGGIITSQRACEIANALTRGVLEELKEAEEIMELHCGPAPSQLSPKSYCSGPTERCMKWLFKYGGKK